jgi:hypothetical protein
MRLPLRIPTGFWFATAAIAPLLGCTPRYAPYPAALPTETPSVAAMGAQPADRVLDCRNPQDAPLCAELGRSAAPPYRQPTPQYPAPPPAISAASTAPAQAANAQPHPNDVDAAVGDCMDAQIATGRYFALPLKDAGLRLMVACEKQANAWMAACEREHHNSPSCTQTMFLSSQTLIRNASHCVNNRSDPQCVDVLASLRENGPRGARTNEAKKNNNPALAALDHAATTMTNSSSGQLLQVLNGLVSPNARMATEAETELLAPLGHCEVSAVKRGSRSAVSLLKNECTREYVDSFPVCTRRGETTEACVVMALLDARLAIEGFEKYCLANLTSEELSRLGCR